MPAEATASVVLVGLESVGKSALFRGLTDAATGDEASFRGSTVICRRCLLHDCSCELVDTPGIRVRSDSATTALALGELDAADTVVLVLRAPYLSDEAHALLRLLRLEARRVAIVVTFADKVSSGLEPAAQALGARLGVPVVTLNARTMTREHRSAVVQAIQAARAPVRGELEAPFPVRLRARRPTRTVFERPDLGPLVALAAIVLLLAVPVVFAYQVASTLQPYLDTALVGPTTHLFESAWPPLAAILAGPYGLLTLGSYSFLWAFPVVVLLGVASSFAEETGLHDRVTAALDPWLRYIGLSGRDLVPVLTGFGCNVVAVLHTRACSSCTRRACVSLISFGSACSYQIGASLSLFGTAGRSWMFAPYLLTVFVVGLLHTRIFHGALDRRAALALHERTYLQRPSKRAVLWRTGSVLRQFLLQAMPVFLLLCFVSGMLEYLGAMATIARGLGPVLHVFGLPEETSLSVVLSVFRKDGMLLLNTANGALLRSLSGGQVFVVVFLASTLTPCLVTLATLRRELGWQAAGSVAGRQAITSTASAWLLGRLLV